MTVSKKVVFSFVLSALLLTGIVVLCHTGNLNSPVRILMFVAVFAALFLVVFFAFGRLPGAGQQHAADTGNEVVKTGEESPQDLSPGLCAAGAPSGNGFLFGGLFSFAQYDPVLLAEAETNVIYEHNGIHYINNDAVNDDKGRTGKLDSHFMELIEAVVGGAQEYP